MPKYPLVSGKIVIARVIRALGYKLPSNYIDDILEWTVEGLGMIQITNTLITTSTGDQDCPGEIITRNHCAPLPCGYVALLAVEDENGRRLPEGADVTDITSQTSLRHNFVDNFRANTFNVNPFLHQTEDGVPTDEAGTSVPYFGEDIQQQATTNRTTHYYKIQGNYIQTSFETGYIKLHYLALPVDSEGYPLIPDNQAFIQCLEWYIIKRLIGSGYQHPVFSYQYADDQFEKYAARGINEVSYYSVDSAAKLNRSLIRLIPPYNLHEDFGVGGEQPELIRK